MNSTKTDWRVGVIGAGKHGSRYARHIVADMKGMTLAAISRRSEEGRRQAEEWGCGYHTDWRQLVADPGVDCLIAALPPVLNREVAAACCRAGKPLLLEKPMAISAVEAQAMLALFSQHGLGLTIGQTLRYNQVIRMLCGHLAEIGTLHGFTVNQRLEPATLGWLDQPDLAGAGVSFHTAIHVFDALRFITGQEIVRVMARTRCLHSQTLEDHLLVLVELESGVLGAVDCSKTGPARSGRFEFTGGAGQLHGDQVHNLGEQIIGMQRLPLDPGAPVSTILPLLQDWLAFLRGVGANPIPGEEGLAAVRVSEACLRSAAQGTWVEV